MRASPVGAPTGAAGGVHGQRKDQCRKGVGDPCWNGDSTISTPPSKSGPESRSPKSSAGTGEERFREIESEVASGLLKEEEAVLATGGGWPAQPGSWEAVPDRTLSVWLRVSPGVAVQRASSEGLVRPLLLGERPLERAVELLEQREASYGRAQVVLDSDEEDPAALATMIMKHIRSDSDRG